MLLFYFFIIFSAIWVNTCWLKSCFSNYSDLFFILTSWNISNDVYWYFIDFDSESWTNTINFTTLSTVLLWWNKKDKRTASEFLIIYSFLLSQCDFTKSTLNTYHKYFSGNSSYFSVPIIDKCWLECCLSTQSWSGSRVSVWNWNLKVLH